MKKIVIKLICVVLILTSNVTAAEIKIVKTISELGTTKEILVSGEIVSGDLIKIKSTVKEYLNTTPETTSLAFLLNSEGGDILESIKIGRFLRKMLAIITTDRRDIYTPDSKEGKQFLSLNKWKEYYQSSVYLKRMGEDLNNIDIPKCYGACVLILASGVVRLSWDTHDHRNAGVEVEFKTVGLLRSSFINVELKKNKTTSNKNNQNIEMVIKEYLLEMGAPLLFQEILKSHELNLIDDMTLSSYLPTNVVEFGEWKIKKCGNVTDYNGLTLDEIIEFRNLDEAFKSYFRNLKRGNYSTWVKEREKFKVGKSKTLRHYDKKKHLVNDLVINCYYKLVRDHQLGIINNINF